MRSGEPIRALVTGAGRRVGAAIAARLARDGARLVLHHHASVEGAAQTLARVRALGGEGVLVRADLTNARDVARLADEAARAWGGLDLLVASAANFERVDFARADEGHWDRALALNLTAPVWLAKKLAPTLATSNGSIVVITDAAAHRAHRAYFPYLVSKGALSQAVRVLAAELAPLVRVNAVAPGAVLLPEGMAAADRAALLARVPLGGEGGSDVVADAVHYLATAPFVTGAELIVDGGASLR